MCTAPLRLPLTNADEKNDRSKQVIRGKVVEYMQRAEKLKVDLRICIEVA